MFIGPLLHEFPSFDLPQSGGCTLGLRSVRPHLWALERFGVSIEALSDRFSISHDDLSPATVVLYESSDTATINSLLAAARIPGESVIKYASANYQVQEVCGYLQALGVGIEGIGTTTLTVQGVADIRANVSYAVAEDPTDAMFFIAAAAATHSALTIKKAPIEFLEVELAVLEKMGLSFSVEDAGISENGITKLADITLEPSTLTAFPEKIHRAPYPGLNIDNLPFFAVIATQAEGDTLIHDWGLREARHLLHRARPPRSRDPTARPAPHTDNGPPPPARRRNRLPALRCARHHLLIGMLAAEGRSTLRNVYSINRGYEDLVERLRSLGADIQQGVSRRNHTLPETLRAKRCRHGRLRIGPSSVVVCRVKEGFWAVRSYSVAASPARILIH